MSSLAQLSAPNMAEPLELVCGLKAREHAVAVRLEGGSFESKPLEWCVEWVM